MVNSKREGVVVGLLTKWLRAIFTDNDTTEEAEEAKQTVKPETVEDAQDEPMTAYWETDKQSHKNRNEAFVDSFLRIPDTTEEAVKESHYKFASFHLFNLPENINNMQHINEYGNVLRNYLIYTHYSIGKTHRFILNWVHDTAYNFVIIEY